MNSIYKSTNWVDCDDIVSWTNEMFEKAKEKIDQLEKDVAELQEEKESLESEIAELKEKIEELEG